MIFTIERILVESNKAKQKTKLIYNPMYPMSFFSVDLKHYLQHFKVVIPSANIKETFGADQHAVTLSAGFSCSPCYATLPLC